MLPLILDVDGNVNSLRNQVDYMQPPMICSGSAANAKENANPGKSKVTGNNFAAALEAWCGCSK
jgi:hypothetical protein